MKDVTAAIIIKNDSILICRRDFGENFAGKWEFPGGKIELRESTEECLRRELLEELLVDSVVGLFFMEHLRL